MTKLPLAKYTRLLGIKDVTHRVGLSRATIYRRLKQEDFPPLVRISERRIGWPEHTIDAWIRELRPWSEEKVS